MGSRWFHSEEKNKGSDYSVVLIRMRLLVLSLCCITLLSACAGSSRTVEVIDAPIQKSVDKKELERIRLKNESARYMRPSKEVVKTDIQPAAKALLRQAQDQYDNAQFESAAALAERALRIEPRRPKIYAFLAEVELKLRHFPRAKQFVLKGLNYAVESSPERLKLNRLLQRLQ